MSCCRLSLHKDPQIVVGLNLKFSCPAETIHFVLSAVICVSGEKFALKIGHDVGNALSCFVCYRLCPYLFGYGVGNALSCFVIY
jgi:hypothetical protein